MEIRTLRYFLILADTLHFGRASQLCSISPSALTRTIQRLEDEVGEKLFERDNRTVTLTRAGTLLRDYAQQAVYGWEDFKDMLSDEEEVRGRVSLYSSVTACYSVLPRLLAAFRNSYPHVHINLQTGDAADALLKVMEGEVDITVAARPEHLPESLEFLEVTSTSLVLVVSADSGIGSLNDIDWGKTPVVLQKHGLARKRIEEWFRKEGINPEIYGEVSGNEAIIAMVGLGCGVGIVPQLVYEKSPMKDMVSIVPIKPELVPYSVGFCVQKKKKSLPAIRIFWEMIGEEIS